MLSKYSISDVMLSSSRDAKHSVNDSKSNGCAIYDSTRIAAKHYCKLYLHRLMSGSRCCGATVAE